MLQSLISNESIYPPLPKIGKHIRLLTVRSGPKDSDITCTLNSASLEDNPRYEALSYTWNRDGSPRTILLNDIATEVYENLWHILNHIRLEDDSRTIWIDALSIRQDDMEEKSQQVRMIHLTFRQALQVIVWLGLATNDCDFLFSELRQAAEQGESYLPGENITRISDAYQTLLNNKYWSRTWIVQEIYLARKTQFMCGSVTIPGHEFALGLYTARSKSVPLWSGSYAGTVVEYIHPEGNQVRTLRNIFDVFDRHGPSQCFDARDKIFALQNMLRTDADEGRIPADFPIVEANYMLEREELLFEVFKAWEGILNVSFANKALGSLDLDWTQVEEYANKKPNDGLRSLYRTIRCSPVFQVTQTWRSEGNDDFCVFDVMWNDTELQYISQNRVQPQQQIIRFDGPASDAAVVLKSSSDDERWSMFGAMMTKTSYMQPASLTHHQAKIWSKDMWRDTVVHLSESQGDSLRIRLSPRQLSYLGLLEYRFRDQLTDHEQSQALSIRWESIGGNNDLLSSERKVFPVLKFDNGDEVGLQLHETAPEDVMNMVQARRQTKIMRALARGRRHMNFPRDT